MKKLLMMLVVLLIASTIYAAPKEVLIFPSGALVTEQARLVVGDEKQAEITLPMVADPDSLTISTGKGKPKVINLQVDSALVNQSRYQELEERIKKSKLERQDVVDNLETQKLALSYWDTQRKQQLEKIEDIQALGKSILAEAAPLKKQISQLARDKKMLDRQIQEMERLLHDKTGSLNQVWKVVVTLDQPAPTIDVTFSYRVHGASWQSLYALNALPQQNAVEWNWRADIRQSTGVDWTDVQLKLATVEPRTTLTPPHVGRWVIRELQVYPSAVPQKAFQRKAVMMETMADSVAGAAPEEVKAKRKEGFVFDVYDLGKHTVQAGQNVTLDINNGSWPVEFSYLSRPIRSPQVFLMANVGLDQFVPMPSGQGSLLVEGVYIGKRPFDLQKKKFDLAFGSDPAIAVKVHREQESDESGLISKTRSQQWVWTVSLTNNKQIPVSVKIEDAKPQVQDKRIEIEAVSRTTTAKAEKDRNIWQLDLPAGANREIKYGFKVEFPADMQVDLGR